MKVLAANFILYTSLSILFISCDEQVYYNIPAEQKIEFTSEDTLIFKSVSGKSDTLLLSMKKDYRNSDKKYNYERIYIHYSRLSKGQIEKITLTIEQSIFGVGISGDGYPFPHISSDKMDNPFMLKSPYYFNGKYLDEVYKLTIYPEFKSNIREVYYTYSYGIILYQYGDSDYFKLQMK